MRKALNAQDTWKVFVNLARSENAEDFDIALSLINDVQVFDPNRVLPLMWGIYTESKMDEGERIEFLYRIDRYKKVYIDIGGLAGRTIDRLVRKKKLK